MFKATFHYIQYRGKLSDCFFPYLSAMMGSEFTFGGICLMRKCENLVAEWDYKKDGSLRSEDCIGDLQGKTEFKSLAAVRPDLVAEWDYEGNNSLSPEDVSAFSQIKVKWRCKKGHRWEATVNSRQRGGGCLMCLKEWLENGR